MTIASQVFNVFKKQIMDGTIDLTANDIRVMLIRGGSSAGSSADRDFDTVQSITTLAEVDGTGYTGGHAGADRRSVSTKTQTIDDANDRAEFDGDDITWTAIGSVVGQCEGALLYKKNTSDGDSVPIAYIKFASTKNLDGGDLTINFDVQGILQFA